MEMFTIILILVVVVISLVLVDSVLATQDKKIPIFSDMVRPLIAKINQRRLEKHAAKKQELEEVGYELADDKEDSAATTDKSVVVVPM